MLIRVSILALTCILVASCKNLDGSETDGTVSAKSHCHEDVWGFDEIEVADKYQGTDLLVKGKIYQSFGQPYTHPIPFQTEEGSQVLVTLGCTNGYADVATTFISKQVISNFDSFLIEFELYGNSVEAGNITHCNVNVDVRREPSKMCVGDLTDEYLEVIDVPSSDVEVNVTGLEACRTPEAGGFCL